MHQLAERSGIMRDILHGQVGPDVYCMLLRNLQPIYAALERELDRHAQSPAIAPVWFPDLYRCPALEADLRYLHGDRWGALPLSSATRDYCARLGNISRDRPASLAAHAYVRYMGDLSGGQILNGIIARALALRDERGTAFYRFGNGTDTAAMKERFRAGLDALPADAAALDAITAEAVSAFGRHVELFEELTKIAGQSRGG